MSGDRLTFSQILLLTAYAVGMTAGQLLFKMAANSYAIADGGAGGRLWGLFYNLYFLSALVLYAGFALLWVWILSFTPLSRAYPFVALAFAHTFACRFAVWRNDFAAPDHRPALDTRRSVFRIGLMEL